MWLWLRLWPAMTALTVRLGLPSTYLTGVPRPYTTTRECVWVTVERRTRVGLGTQLRRTPRVRVWVTVRHAARSLRMWGVGLVHMCLWPLLRLWLRLWPAVAALTRRCGLLTVDLLHI